MENKNENKMVLHRLLLFFCVFFSAKTEVAEMVFQGPIHCKIGNKKKKNFTFSLFPSFLSLRPTENKLGVHFVSRLLPVVICVSEWRGRGEGGGKRVVQTNGRCWQCSQSVSLHTRSSASSWICLLCSLCSTMTVL